jgi:hypothetical protein
MDREQFVVSPVSDPYSPGFSVQEISGLLLKKHMWRVNTASQTKMYNEQIYTPTIYPSQVIGQAIPESPPTDFVSLSDADIKTTFGITSEDIKAFTIRENGLRVFKIWRSQAYPYIYKVDNCKLIPWAGNKDLTFSGMGPESGVNLLQKVISFNIYDGVSWKGTFTRTASDGSLSRLGKDTILASQLAYGFDYDSGIFTCYEVERNTYTPNPICSRNPPAVTCYIYRGLFGNYTSANLSGGLWTQSTSYIFNPTRVVIGKGNSSSDANTLEVSGRAQIDSIVTQSIDTFSDRRLKENIVSLKPNYKILELNTYTYNYIAKAGDKEIGVIAQETEKIVPEIVKEHAGFKTVQYDRIGVLLLPIVKELAEKIARLEEDNKEMKTIVSSLKGVQSRDG